MKQSGLSLTVALFLVAAHSALAQDSGKSSEASPSNPKPAASQATDGGAPGADAAAGMAEQEKPAGTAGAEETHATAAVPSYETTVNAERGRPLIGEARAISILTQDELRRSTGLFLEDALNLLPGVRMESRTTSGGQRITIRGYGNSTNFNGTGYRAYLDDIPLTDAEGATILDDVDVSTLSGVEVIRGPASSLYGAGIGGVVKLYSLRPRFNATRVTQEVLGGTYGLLRTNTRVEHGDDNAAILLNYGHQHSDGYRVHTQSTKDYVTATANFRASSRQSLSAVVLFSRSSDELAGQLTEEQFFGRENVAEPAYLANDGHVAISSVRFGISHRYQLTSWLTNTSVVFASGSQLDQPFAVGRTDNLSLNAGARTEFTLRFPIAGLPVTGVVGAEVQQTNAFKKSYAMANGTLGGIRTDLEVIALQANPLFTQWTVELPLELSATAGASVNLVRYNLRDRLTNSANPTHLDNSGVKQFEPVVTPRVALNKEFGRDLSVYAQLSEGYTPPASGSVIIPQAGTVNTALRPERGTLLELGTKGVVLGGRLAYEAAVFNLHVTDKLTPQAVTDPTTGTTLYTITTNAGAQDNRGVELAARYNIGTPFVWLTRLEPFITYTWSDFRYSGFKSDNNKTAATIDYTGNRVAGVPPHLVNAGVDVATSWGVYFDGTYQYVSTMPLTFDNAHSAPEYSLVNAKLGYRRELGGGFRIDVAAGTQNALGSRYYTMAFLNASYSGASPNVYLNGPYSPTFYGAVTVSYSP